MDVKTICMMRDIFKAMANLELEFEMSHQITLNEAVILCTLKKASGRMTATALSKQALMSPSHTSKTLRMLEEKGLIIRILGKEDRRLMYFHLSSAGKQRVDDLEQDQMEIPKWLKPLF